MLTNRALVPSSTQENPTIATLEIAAMIRDNSDNNNNGNNGGGDININININKKREKKRVGRALSLGEHLQTQPINQ